MIQKRVIRREDGSIRFFLWQNLLVAFRAEDMLRAGVIFVDEPEIDEFFAKFIIGGEATILRFGDTFHRRKVDKERCSRGKDEKLSLLATVCVDQWRLLWISIIDFHIIEWATKIYRKKENIGIG